MRVVDFLGTIIFVAAASLSAQDPDAAKRKTAVIQLVADAPQLTYDIRFTGGDSTTMPTALKYLIKDLAQCEGWYLTGEDKSKTVASQAKRIWLETTKAKSKVSGTRVNKIEVKELPGMIACVVSYGKKANLEDVKRTGGVLDTFARKYVKLVKGAATTVTHAETAKPSVWSFEVRYKEPAKEKK